MEAIATFTGLISGTVIFTPDKTGTKVIIRLKNLPPSSIHAIHIHEFGDLSKGCKSAGAHYNPYKKNHGSLATPSERHEGDMCNNIVSNYKGEVNYTYMDPLKNIKNIIGRSVVVHEGVDDLGLGGNKESLETGNAGKRLDCAVIGIRSGSSS